MIKSQDPFFFIHITKFHIFNFLNKRPHLSKHRELLKSLNAIVLRIKFPPIQNRKMDFKSLKWIKLGVHIIKNSFFKLFYA